MPLYELEEILLYVCSFLLSILSLWYFTFYCDPRLTEIVVVKILMEGIHATAVVYSGLLTNHIIIILSLSLFTIIDMNFSIPRVLSLQGGGH